MVCGALAGCGGGGASRPDRTRGAAGLMKAGTSSQLPGKQGQQKALPSLPRGLVGVGV